MAARCQLLPVCFERCTALACHQVVSQSDLGDDYMYSVFQHMKEALAPPPRSGDRIRIDSFLLPTTTGDAV